ncbi:Uncharacterised protein [Mycobacteroides abscessus subsp. abscessus]|nr:Uncharacterised protein [Mycobacteroides abscessus subsp. abscessus]
MFLNDTHAHADFLWIDILFGKIFSRILEPTEYR